MTEHSVYCFDQLPGSLWLRPDMPPSDGDWSSELQFRDDTPIMVVTTDQGTNEYPFVPFVPMGR